MREFIDSLGYMVPSLVLNFYRVDIVFYYQNIAFNLFFSSF